jgi:hypothetical protein
VYTPNLLFWPVHPYLRWRLQVLGHFRTTRIGPLQGNLNIVISKNVLKGQFKIYLIFYTYYNQLDDAETLQRSSRVVWTFCVLHLLICTIIALSLYMPRAPKSRACRKMSVYITQLRKASVNTSSVRSSAYGQIVYRTGSFEIALQFCVVRSVSVTLIVHSYLINFSVTYKYYIQVLRKLALFHYSLWFSQYCSKQDVWFHSYRKILMYKISWSEMCLFHFSRDCMEPP